MPRPKYTTWQNTVYILREAWRFDKLVFLYCGVFTILSAIAPFITIFFPRWILQELLGPKDPRSLLLILTGFFITASVVGFFKAWLQGAYYPRMIKIRLEFHKAHQKKCMTTDFQNTEDPKFLNDMETALRCLQSNNQGVEGLLHKLFAFAGNLLALFGYIAIISNLSLLVLLYLVINVIITYLTTFAAKKFEHSKKDDISQVDRRTSYLYSVMYDFSYGKELRLLGIRDWIARMFQAYRQERLGIQRQIRWRYFAYGLIDLVLLLIREGVIYAYLIYLVIRGGLSIPDFMMYFLTISGFAGWFQMMLSDLAYMRAQNLEICDYRSFIDTIDRTQTIGPQPIGPPPHELEFRNVSFKYPRSEEYILQGLNLRIPPGQRLALVGPNGAGKTTLVKLLCRLYDVSEGEILLGGRNIKEYDREEYYRLFSVVFQEIITLAFSVAENVSLTEECIDQLRLSRALEDAGLAEKVAQLSRGIHTGMLKILDEEGVELSGGEKQRLAIARALYKDGAIMILDEPTAALDPLAEHGIYTSFNRMVGEKTAIYISHRLASTHFCDQIAFFEKGQLVEYGSHAELMAKKGRYAEMFSVQAKYYQDQEEGAVG